MAQLSIPLEELIGIIKANNILPPQVTDARAQNNGLELVIKTPIPLLPPVPVTLQFVSFENNTAKLELVLANAQLEKAAGMLTKTIESKLPEFINLDLPYILVNIDTLLRRKDIKGIRIKDITCIDDTLKIETENT